MSTVFTHSIRRVGGTVQFANVKQVGVIRGEFLQVRTNEGVHRGLMLLASKGLWHGRMATVRLNGNESTVVSSTASTTTPTW